MSSGMEQVKEKLPHNLLTHTCVGYYTLSCSRLESSALLCIVILFFNKTKNCKLCYFHLEPVRTQ